LESAQLLRRYSLGTFEIGNSGGYFIAKEIFVKKKQTCFIYARNYYPLIVYSVFLLDETIRRRRAPPNPSKPVPSSNSDEGSGVATGVVVVAVMTKSVATGSSKLNQGFSGNNLC
jgi:hypothetical protein